MKKLNYFFCYFILMPLGILISFTAEAQSIEHNELSKNNLYFNTGANVFGWNSNSLIIALVNYERRIHSGETITWYGKAGFGVAGEVNGDGGTGGLGAITMLTGNGNSHFEISAGAFFAYKDYVVQGNSWFVLPLFDVGYRYQKPEGGFIFKAYIGNTIGIGLGHAFRIKKSN